MIEIESVIKTNLLFSSLDAYRKISEDALTKSSKVFHMFCSFCQDVTPMTLDMASKSWVDLRGQFGCQECGLCNRDRLLYESVISELTATRNHKILMFEFITHLFHRLKEKCPHLIGVEYGGGHLKSGDSFHFKKWNIVHQDMQKTSYEANSFDIIIHSDVLEHIPDPMLAMKEILRILKPGGKCYFSTPIYSNRFQHTQRAVVENGELRFLNGPAYHGNPLNPRGAPVFYEFGLNLLEDLNNVGFQTCYLVDHSLLKGIVSNNNPYTDIGHMWPIVVRCQKPIS